MVAVVDMVGCGGCVEVRIVREEWVLIMRGGDRSSLGAEVEV